MNKITSQFLDLARWVSAMLVVITHLNNRMLTGLSDIPSDKRGILTYGWGFLTGFGSQAVIVFFVLSGFLVGGKSLTLLKDKKPIELRKYAIDRIARIYVVLIPTIILITVVDYAGVSMFESTQIYKHYDLPKHQTIAAFLGTFANFQGIFTQFWGTNGPLTTLANEFWYYIVFPLLAAPWMTKRNAWIRFGFPIIGVCVLILWSFHNTWFGLGFVYWCIGAFARIAKRPLIPCRPWIAAAVLIGYLAATRVFIRAEDLSNPVSLFISGLILCILFANLTLTLLYSSSVPGKLLSNRFHNTMANFSYSLYAIHASLLTFICAFLKYRTGFGWKEIPTMAWHWGMIILVFAGTYAAAMIFAGVTEKHTRLFRFLGYRLAGVDRSSN